MDEPIYPYVGASVTWPRSGDAAWRQADHPFHVYHMELCLAEAAAAAAEDEVPVGAVIIHPERGVIASAHNQRERLQDPTAHAEMIALTQAANALKSWRLEQCILYVTLEPCVMCAGAAVNARLGMIVYGADDPKAGACRSLYQIPDDKRLPHRLAVVGGVLAEQCAAVLSEFFRERRRWGRK
ncbi:MAG: tRNA adenosine(34) deaminase TadA [Gemmataceae bacterium]|nr:tRNA adenosine(34) deaminase TadA [Gemmataceae bacterium]MCS7272076.1 tRNA adenosine(34) deaminase TadA [Gemmataceae bacterium]MDW8243271.1 tRNA adenosine(34) deaminase TadA [Thermogemmata sp.]